MLVRSFDQIVSLICGTSDDSTPAAFSAARNGPVRKHIDGLEACEAPVGLSVYASGTMSGHWLDGSAFQGVRFCDRLVLRDGLIAEMQVRRDPAA